MSNLYEKDPAKLPGQDVSSDTEKGGLSDTHDESILEGELKYQKLSWQKLTVCLIVTAIALGSLSIPSAFAAVGMVAGVILTVGLGFIAIYTSKFTPNATKLPS